MKVASIKRSPSDVISGASPIFSLRFIVDFFGMNCSVVSESGPGQAPNGGHKPGRYTASCRPHQPRSS